MLKIKVKHSPHGRLTGLPLAQFKLLQAAFRGDVVPKGSPEDLKSLGSKEYGASFCFLELAKGIVEVLDPENPARRCCLCRNPKSAERETGIRLLQCTREGLEKIAASKRRAKEAAIGSRVGRVLQQYKMGKFVAWEVIQRRLTWSFDEGKIAAEALFDGCYIIHSEVSKDMMPAAEVVASYKSLELWWSSR